jgi:hypothetical protein
MGNAGRITPITSLLFLEEPTEFGRNIIKKGEFLGFSCDV